MALRPRTSIRKRPCRSTRSRPGSRSTISHLEVTVKLVNPDKSKFERAAEGARVGCPISKLIASAKITLDAKLA